MRPAGDYMRNPTPPQKPTSRSTRTSSVKSASAGANRVFPTCQFTRCVDTPSFEPDGLSRNQNFSSIVSLTQMIASHYCHALAAFP